MLLLIAMTLTGLGLGAFMVNRLYVLFTEKRIKVKGITYSREGEPILYWLVAVMAAFGLLAGSTLFVLGAGVLAFNRGS